MRTMHTLIPASDTALETRARCQDDNHPAGAYNPLLDETFCHCGRLRWAGVVERVRWPDDEARLTEHVRGS